MTKCSIPYCREESEIIVERKHLCSKHREEQLQEANRKNDGQTSIT